MAKRSSVPGNSNRVETDTGEVKETRILVDFDLPEPVVQQLVLLKNVTLKITGSVSGTLYVFDGAGSVVDVDIRDVDKMMEKNTPTSCCGAGGPTPYFAIVGG